MNTSTIEINESIKQIEKRINFELRRHGSNQETIERIFETFFQDLDLPKLVKLEEMFKALLLIKPEFCENQHEYKQKIILLKKHLNYRKWRLNQITHQADITPIEIMRNTHIPSQDSVVGLTAFVYDNLNGINKEFVKGMQYVIGGVR